MRRIERINSLLREVLTDVIRKEVKNPHLPDLVGISHVDVTRDLRYAKVYVSVIGEPDVRKKALDALQSAAGFIAVTASKKVDLRFFPELRFILDDSVDQQMRIEELLGEIKKQRKSETDE